jgi:hypothetical protein
MDSKQDIAETEKMCEDSKPGLRLMISKEAAPHSPLIFNSMMWVCSCMHGRNFENKSTLRLEAINIWRLLHSSSESRVKKGEYAARLPYLLRMITRKVGEPNVCSGKLSGNVLSFEENKNLHVLPGLYGCQICVKLSNPTWRLSPSECAFIEGRGSCAVTVFLCNFSFVGPIPTTPSTILEVTAAIKLWALSIIHPDVAQIQSMVDASRASP